MYTSNFTLRDSSSESRLGIGGEMSKIMDTQDLVGDQDLLEDSRGKHADKKPQSERHGADELLSSMKGMHPLAAEKAMGCQCHL